MSYPAHAPARANGNARPGPRASRDKAARARVSVNMIRNGGNAMMAWKTSKDSESSDGCAEGGGSIYLHWIDG